MAHINYIKQHLGVLACFLVAYSATVLSAKPASSADSVLGPVQKAAPAFNPLAFSNALMANVSLQEALNCLPGMLEPLTLQRARMLYQGQPEILDKIVELARQGLATGQPRSTKVAQWLPDAHDAAVQLAGSMRMDGGKGPASSAYARRLLVGALVHQAAACGDACKSLQPQMHRLLLQLYEAHRSAALHKAVLEFYHISKAGGTSFCQASASVGCKTYSTGAGHTCLIPSFSDGPRWIPPAVHARRCARLQGIYAQSLQQQAQRLAGTGSGGSSGSGSPGSSSTLPPVLAPCKDLMYQPLVQYGVRMPLGTRDGNCTARAAYLALKGWNFYASEYTPRKPPDARTHAMFSAQPSSSSFQNRSQPSGSTPVMASAPHLCGNMLNVLMLREPRARLLSHLGFAVKVYHDKLARYNLTHAFFTDAAGDAAQAEEQEHGHAVSHSHRGLAAWQELLPAATDNYYIRSLLGEDTFYMTHGSLTRDDLHAALGVLASIDTLLVLEGSHIHQQLGFAYGLGWGHTMSRYTRRSASAYNKGRLLAIVQQVLPKGSALEALWRANKLDEELYRSSAVLVSLDALVWSAAAAESRVPLEGLPPEQQPKTTLVKSRRCGYVRAASKRL